jgi:transcriptional regulator with XRE-family HTH domain
MPHADAPHVTTAYSPVTSHAVKLSQRWSWLRKAAMLSATSTGHRGCGRSGKAETFVDNLPKLLHDLRERAGLTREQVSEATGAHVETVGRIERGKVNPPLKTLEALLSVYGYKVSIVPNESTPEDVEALVLLVQAGRALNDAVESLLHDPNAGSLMERFTTLERVSRSFKRIDSLVHKERDDDNKSSDASDE